MNTHDQNHEPSGLDELQDHFVDRILAEVVGHETPPNLSERILASSVAFRDPQLELPPKRSFFRTPWVQLVVAASLLIGFSLLLLSNVHSVRQVSRSAAKFNRLSNSEAQVADQSGNEFGNRYALSDSGNPAEDIAAGLPVEPQGPSNGPVTVQESGETMSEPQLNELGRMMEWRVPRERAAAITDTNAKPQDTQPLQMLVTPRIVIQEEEERLGIHPDQPTHLGTGPGASGDRYTRIVENPFIKAEGGAAVSTFSIDVDTASYANVRQFLMQMNQLPPSDAIRIEELINYFDYDYAGPATGPAEGLGNSESPPFAAHVEVAGCPWTPEHRLVRIGIKGREMNRDKRPQSNLVFLVDVSGSMDEPAKLPLVVNGLEQLTRQLGENDRVAIVVYAGSEGLALPSTRGSEQKAILEALGRLKAGGSTAGGAGITLAYQIAEDNFIQDGTNRVILCTDGDFNVGVTSTAELDRLVEKKARDTGVFLSVLGFGRGNLNDSMMEAIADHGNGNYHYVDNRSEARRVLVEEMTGTLVTIAKDVKIQVEFNPTQVAGYRLIGYENRMLRTEDFNDDKKDAGEIGAGHTVTALYEIVPAGKQAEVAPTDDLKYQQANKSTSAIKLPDNGNESAEGVSDELLTLKMRYKQPEGDTSQKLEWPVRDEKKAFGEATGDFQFAAAVAGFGLLLRDSQYKGNLTYDATLETAQSSLGRDEHGYRAEFLDLVRRAKSLSGK